MRHRTVTAVLPIIQEKLCSKKRRTWHHKNSKISSYTEPSDSNDSLSSVLQSSELSNFSNGHSQIPFGPNRHLPVMIQRMVMTASSGSGPSAIVTPTPAA